MDPLAILAALVVILALALCLMALSAAATSRDVTSKFCALAETRTIGPLLDQRKLAQPPPADPVTMDELVTRMSGGPVGANGKPAWSEAYAADLKKELDAQKE